MKTRACPILLVFTHIASAEGRRRVSSSGGEQPFEVTNLGNKEERSIHAMVQEVHRFKPVRVSPGGVLRGKTRVEWHVASP